MKRLNSVLLIGAMLASVLSGCGNPQTSEDSPKKVKPSANTTQNSIPQDAPGQNDSPQDVPNQNDTKQFAQQISKITSTHNDDGTVHSLVDTYEYDDNHGLRSHKETADGRLYKDNTYDGSLELLIYTRVKGEGTQYGYNNNTAAFTGSVGNYRSVTIEAAEQIAA